MGNNHERDAVVQRSDESEAENLNRKNHQENLPD